jgi:hypothetical protein
MMRNIQSGFFLVALAVASLTAMAEAQPSQDAAPIPAPITAAKKVFFSNAGQDGLGGFSGDPDRTYNQFYAAVKASGQYELGSAPGNADLVFEISFTVPNSGTTVIKGDSVGAAYAPEFNLRILDPKTHFTLWSFTEHVQWAVRAGNRDQNFDQGMANLGTRLKKLTTQSTSV